MNTKFKPKQIPWNKGIKLSNEYKKKISEGTKIKSLPKEDLVKMIKYVQVNYISTKESLIWAKKVLNETKTTKAKLLMYCNEIKK